MNLSMIRGNSKLFAFPLTNSDGDPIDLTGATVTMTAKAAYTDTDAAAVFQKTEADGITVVSALNGVITVDLDPADTSSLTGKVNRLIYDIQVQDADDRVSTPVRGKLVVQPDVTETIVEVS